MARRRTLEQDLAEHQELQQLIIIRTRRAFGCDIAKACHHGASDVLDSFLYAVNPVATIISSGDDESHAHPRPDALGAFGKSSRGERPLIFSTELARSTKEFSYPIKYHALVEKMKKYIDGLQDPKRKKIATTRLERLRDSNVVTYGMITVRTDGENVLIAQKLEKERSAGQRWDLYDLRWNKKLDQFEYVDNIKGH